MPPYQIHSRAQRCTRELKSDALNHLEQLTTTPEHILTFLPPMDRMSSLTSVAINIEGEGYIDFGVVKEALKCFSSCVKKIELTLYIFSSQNYSGLEAWPEQSVHPNSSFQRGDGVTLRCVEYLHLRNGKSGYREPVFGQPPTWLKIFPELPQRIQGYMEHVLVQLPDWLKMFPELQQLTFHTGRRQLSLVPVEYDILHPFIEQVKLAYPTITPISSIQGDSDWTHPDSCLDRGCMEYIAQIE